MKKSHIGLGLNAFLLLSLGVSQLYPHEIKFFKSKKQSNKYSFTDEELEKLKSLSGKAKKKYIKELKIKYMENTNGTN